MIDNSAIIRPFVPATDDGDRFLYTEILDRTKRPGNNGARLLRTFYHRSHEDFDRHLIAIQTICEATMARAYTRLAARSFRAVSELHLRLCLDAHLTANFAGVKTLYNSACGKVSPIERLWLFDVDELSGEALELHCRLANEGLLVATLPSKRGKHFVVRPHQIRGVLPAGVENKKDCPTNLFIPDGAA